MIAIILSYPDIVQSRLDREVTDGHARQAKQHELSAESAP